MFSRPRENSDSLRELWEKLRQDSRDSFRLLQNFGIIQSVPSCMMKLATASS